MRQSYQTKTKVLLAIRASQQYLISRALAALDPEAKPCSALPPPSVCHVICGRPHTGSYPRRQGMGTSQEGTQTTDLTSRAAYHTLDSLSPWSPQFRHWSGTTRAARCITVEDIVLLLISALT